MIGKQHEVRTFLVGKNAKYILKHMPTHKVWTSVNTLVERQPTFRSGWPVGDPYETSFAASANTVPWVSGEPGGSTIGYLAEATSIGMRSVTQYDAKKNYVCELSLNSVPKGNVRKSAF